MTTLTKTSFALAAIAAAALTACGGGSTTTPTTGGSTQRVSINFAAAVGQTPLASGVCSGIRVDGVAYRKDATGANVPVNTLLNDLRFYVGNISLLKADGTSVQVTLDSNNWQGSDATASVALIDFEDGSCLNNTGGTPGTNTVITGTVPTGTYTGVHFELGVPETLNHSNPTTTAIAPISTSVPGMAWAWQSGRKHMKIELSPENATVPGTFALGVQTVDATGAQATTTVGGITTNAPNTSTFVYHLGATNCVADAAATATGGFNCGTTSNQQHFHLAAFNAATQKVTLDLKALFANQPVTTNTNGTAAGCMSAVTDPECAAMYAMFVDATDEVLHPLGTVFTAR
jgi:uncharacterized repeat protein (TIGR04052 family)